MQLFETRNPKLSVQLAVILCVPQSQSQTVSDLGSENLRRVIIHWPPSNAHCFSTGFIWCIQETTCNRNFAQVTVRTKCSVLATNGQDVQPIIFEKIFPARIYRQHTTGPWSHWPVVLTFDDAKQELRRHRLYFSDRSFCLGGAPLQRAPPQRG